MSTSKTKEVWMRGPIEGVPSLLQPVAHALLQVKEDAFLYTESLPETSLWERPYKLANIAFHLQHISGVIDRMFTYADQKSLDEEQFAYLAQEGKTNPDLSLKKLLAVLEVQIDKAITYLKTIDTNHLTETRYLGRQRIPTTLIGLLFHSAEHAQRHLGQLLVTARIMSEQNKHKKGPDTSADYFIISRIHSSK